MISLGVWTAISLLAFIGLIWCGVGLLFTQRKKTYYLLFVLCVVIVALSAHMADLARAEVFETKYRPLSEFKDNGRKPVSSKISGDQLGLTYRKEGESHG